MIKLANISRRKNDVLIYVIHI